MFGEGHFDCSSPGHYPAGLHGSPHNHDGVVETALRLCDELLCPSSEDNRAGFGQRTVFEEIVSLCSDTFLLKLSTLSETFLRQSIHSCLNDSSCGLGYSYQIFVRHSSCAKQTSICEILCREISDGQFAQNDLGSGVDDLVQLIVDDLPLGIHYGLILVRLFESDLGIFLFGLQLQLQIQKTYVDISDELLLLLLEAGVGESFFEGYSIDHKTIHDAASGDHFDSDKVLVQ